MTDLATLGDKTWRFTVKSEQIVEQPKPGIILTGTVPHYGRDVIVFLPVGSEVPEIGKTITLMVKNDAVIYPIPERHRTA